LGATGPNQTNLLDITSHLFEDELSPYAVEEGRVETKFLGQRPVRHTALTSQHGHHFSQDIEESHVDLSLSW
jgi:hypothetical protein